jgi:protein-tyrosine phosphatase
VRKVDGYPLWIGHVGDPGHIVSNGILVVVNVAANEPPASLPRDLTYCRFPLIDGHGNPTWLLRVAVETVACLLGSGTPTLVHCGAGMSRSPCIAAAAIASVQGCDSDEALELVLQSGPADVSPALWTDIRAVIA